MIGKFIRSTRHLVRMVSENKEPLHFIYFYRGGEIGNGIAVPCTFTNKKTNGAVICNTLYGHDSCGGLTYETHSQVRQIMNDNNLYRCFSTEQENFFNVFSWCIILPNNFEDEINKFLANNKKMHDFINSSIGTNSPMFQFLFAIFGASPNNLQWAINIYYHCHITPGFFLRINNFIENYNQVIKNLKRGSLTSYTNNQRLGELIEEITIIERNKRAKDAVKTFNTAQKKLLSSIELNNTQSKLLSRFQTLSDVKRKNFVRKMSNIESVDEIFHQLVLTTRSTFEWNRNSLVDYINNADEMKCSIVFDNDNVIIVRVDNYETIKYLAKTTNWCISKNKSYWNNYVKHSDITQFMLFDFNQKEDGELSIVGFTVNNRDTITAAHSFTNRNLVCNNGGNNNYVLTSFLEQIEESSIFQILKKYNVTINMLFNEPTVKPKYDWNKESFMSFLDYAVGGNDNYTIYELNDNFVAFITNSNMVRFMLEGSGKNIVNNATNTKIFMLADFTKNENESNRLYFGFVFKGDSNTENVETLYNINGGTANIDFNTCLSLYNLPYNIICRPNDVATYLRSYFMTYNVPCIKNTLKNDEVKAMLRKKNDYRIKQDIYSSLNRSLIRYKSFDILDAIYESGLTLFEILDMDFICPIITEIIREIDRQSNGYLSGWMPSVISFDNLNNEGRRLTIHNKRNLIGTIMELQKIINGEKNNPLLAQIFNNIDYISSMHNETRVFLLTKLVDTIGDTLINEAVANNRLLYAIGIDVNLTKHWANKFGYNAEFLKKLMDSCSSTNARNCVKSVLSVRVS